MPRARNPLYLVLLGVALMLPITAADAQDGWLGQELARLAAVPRTLAAVRSNAWLQIPGGERQRHNVSADAYRAILPRLDALATAALPDLEHELDGILNGLTFDGLRTTSARQKLDYCGWIGPARPDGITPDTPDLQSTLFTRCRTVAAVVVSRLLDQHADALDLRLPALPRLDLAFPRWLLADLAQPDSTGALALDAVQRQAAYQDRLERRIAAAGPAIRSDLDRTFAARTWQGGAIDSPDADCRAQLGPLAGGELGSACRDASTRWIASLLPAMTAALPSVVATALVKDPSLDENALCRSILSAWLPAGLPPTIAEPARDACLREARRAIAQAAEDRARANAQAAAREASARAASLASEQRATVAPRPLPAPEDTAAWQSGNRRPVKPDDNGAASRIAPGTYAEAQTSRASLDAAAARSRKEATVRLVEQISAAFASAGGAETPDVARMCAGQARPPGDVMLGNILGQQPNPDAVRRQLEGFQAADGLSASEARAWVTGVCRTGYDAMLARRLAKADADSGVGQVFAPGMPFWVRTPDGALQAADPARLVHDAAVDGLQVVFVPGGLLRSPKVGVTPFGRTQPRLDGTLRKLVRADGVEGLEVTGLPSLPGLDGPAATIICLALPTAQAAYEGQLQTAFGFLLGGLADAPRTGGEMARNGWQAAEAAAACQVAKRQFIENGR